MQSACLEWAEFDPNYNYGEEPAEAAAAAGSGVAMEAGEEDEDADGGEDDGDYGEADDDFSWKSRRAAVRVLAAIVGSCADAPDGAALLHAGVFAHHFAEDYRGAFESEDDYLGVPTLVRSTHSSLRAINDLRNAIEQEVAAAAGRWNPLNLEAAKEASIGAGHETGRFQLEEIGDALRAHERNAGARRSRVQFGPFGLLPPRFRKISRSPPRPFA